MGVRLEGALVLAGAGLVIVGVALWSVPAALVTAGVLCIASALWRVAT